MSHDDIEIVEKEKKDQPKPKMFLQDLAQYLEVVDVAIGQAQKLYTEQLPQQPITPIVKELYIARTQIRNIMFEVRQALENQQSIDPVIEPTQDQQVIAKAFNQERPQFYVSGVQLIENKRLVGTSLYSTMPKAKHIAGILNRKFAELKVEHEAKIIQYPVF